MAEKTNENNNSLKANLDKLHTTSLGMERVKRNLSLDDNVDIVSWCRKKIDAPDSTIARKGKNWYITKDSCTITVNAYSYTIITAHRIKDSRKN